MKIRATLIVAALLVSVCFAGNAHAVLQAYWKFDEAAGSTAANSSGSVTNYNGALTNFVNDNSQWQSGRFGNALGYADGNDVVLLSTNVVDINANWTISSWFLAPISDVSTPLHHTLTRGNTADHQIILNNTAQHPLGSYDNAGLTNFQGVTPAFNTNTLSAGWHQVVAVGTGTTTTFFVDGVKVGNNNVKSTSDIYALGNYQFGGQKFADKLDDMGVFDQALTDAEAKSLFSLAMEPSLNYSLEEANQLIQAFESSAPSVQIGNNLWRLVTDGSLTSPEGQVAAGGLYITYAINLGNGNGFIVGMVPEPSSLLLGGMGCLMLLARRRRARSTEAAVAV